MKLIIDQSLENGEVEITVKCGLIDERLERLIEHIRLYSFALTGKKDGASHVLRPEDICYFESVDERTYAYNMKEVYECDQKLYELEHILGESSFVRISKAAILNTAYLKSVRALLNGKLEGVLKNGEKLIISRHYVAGLKERLGL